MKGISYFFCFDWLNKRSCIVLLQKYHLNKNLRQDKEEKNGGRASTARFKCNGRISKLCNGLIVLLILCPKQKK